MDRTMHCLTASKALACLACLLVTTVAAVAGLSAAAVAENIARNGSLVLVQADVRDPYAPRTNTGRYSAPLPRDGAPGGRVEGDRWVPESPNRDDYAGPVDPAPSARYEREYDREPENGRYDDRRNGYVDEDPRDRGPDRWRGADADRGDYYDREQPYDREPDYEKRDTYSENEIVDAGHRFFGTVSRGLARAVNSVISRSGPPNGYILGEDAGGAFVAGLRYGEGRLYTKRFGNRKVYWQGPSLGYDFGGEGSKVMVLVYNLRRPGDIYRRFGGVQGSAYMIGGISVQFQKSEDILLAPIRAGVGLRIGANVGYLKYTRRPTWNPF